MIKNKRASFDYAFLKTYTAGIKLSGSEARFIRSGWATLTDSYCYFSNDELFVKGLSVHQGSKNMDHEPERPKKLLLKKKELRDLQKGLDKGITIVPIKIIESNGRFKLEIALAKGKKEYDKRETIKARDAEREKNRELNTR
jgi:SsrA-binding protein